VAVTLALARAFAQSHPLRTIRFVAFTNEEPPHFWTENMGSLVYARSCRNRAEKIVAMLSIESVGFYSSAANSQQYPLGLTRFYPSIGDFVAFVGNLRSRSLVHETVDTFRRADAVPSIGASLPNSVTGVGWSDHWSFWQQGFSGIEITDTAPYRNPYYHTPGDTPDRLNYDHLARFAHGMRAVAARLANQ
jgi:Zn-dependent M28 family amino/carboxypeptidase